VQTLNEHLDNPAGIRPAGLFRLFGWIFIAPGILMLCVSALLSQQPDFKLSNWFSCLGILAIFWLVKQLDFDKFPDLTTWGFFSAVSLSILVALVAIVVPHILLLLINLSWDLHIPITPQSIVAVLILLVNLKITIEVPSL